MNYIFHYINKKTIFNIHTKKWDWSDGTRGEGTKEEIFAIFECYGWIV